MYAIGEMKGDRRHRSEEPERKPGYTERPGTSQTRAELLEIVGSVHLPEQHLHPQLPEMPSDEHEDDHAGEALAEVGPVTGEWVGAELGAGPSDPVEAIERVIREWQPQSKTSTTSGNGSRWLRPTAASKAAWPPSA